MMMSWHAHAFHITGHLWLESTGGSTLQMPSPSIYSSQTWSVMCLQMSYHLTYWGRVTHICVSKLTSSALDIGLSPGRHEAIIWTNAGIFLIRTRLRNKLQWNLKQYSCIFIQESAFENVVWKMAAILPRPQCFNGTRHSCESVRVYVF